MFSLNRAQIIGNLTRDPEMRYTPNGQAVCSFGVATNRRWRDKDGNNQEQTEFHNLVAWGKLAEITSQILHKGNRVYVEGRLQTRQWEGQDGAKRNRTEIVMDNFVALTPKGETPAAPAVSEEIEEIPIEEKATPATPPPTEETPQKDEEEKLKPKKIAEKEKDVKLDEGDINLDDIPF